MLLDFVQRPSNQTVAQGQVAHLTCQHSSAIELGWNVNDTIITDQDVGEDIQRQRLGSVHQLIIKARPYFNSTRVKCVAYFSNETISSPWAFVIIQGWWVCCVCVGGGGGGVGGCGGGVCVCVCVCGWVGVGVGGVCVCEEF